MRDLQTSYVGQMSIFVIVIFQANHLRPQLLIHNNFNFYM